MCWSRLIRRSKRRSLIEVMLFPMFVRPYRCMECDWRFFRWSVLNEGTHKRHCARHISKQSL